MNISSYSRAKFLDSRCIVNSNNDRPETLKIPFSNYSLIKSLAISFKRVCIFMLSASCSAQLNATVRWSKRRKTISPSSPESSTVWGNSYVNPSCARHDSHLPHVGSLAENMELSDRRQMVFSTDHTSCTFMTSLQSGQFSTCPLIHYS